MFRISLILATALALASPLQAKDRAMKKISKLPSAHAKSVCYEIQGRQGWQRMNMPANSDAQVLTIFGPKNTSRQDKKAYPKAKKIGWSVIDLFHKRVGPEGHHGAAAVALAPFDIFKYFNDAPHGAILVRLPNGWIGDVRDPNRPISLSGEAYYDFRINDSDQSLGDNGGFLVMCIVDAAHY
ncbi:hypothetical protein GCM10007939_00950 [Amylibacter marinus]|uniref:Uncharacterized protein n=1 Tax=Amylibacter marinus TaxID=1475483 RepID=A0ABQ5VRR5_9RHOB|nr:hypothetical protein [Amylibacter marinus]GLQ33812.1 hypothetical protein GCM10007939_00950 [Amylibacter marinus]